MIRAALYARYSTDNQSEASIADQWALCRAEAERRGAEVAREFSDAAISGSAMANRPGVRALMAAVRAGEIDLVIAEHTDRLSRAGEDTWAIFKDLRAAGVQYVTVNQGEISHMHVGLSGTMSEMLIEETRRKTRRGLRGVVEAGRSGGGLTYGYAKKRVYDAAGEPVRGHLDIDPGQAAVVTRIFRDYAAGASPLAIAAALNAEGVPAPRGGLWQASTIHGNARRGNGVIHNELYAGVRVWGRQTFVKDRITGARRARAAEGPPVRQDVPELRIVPEDLWQAARGRYTRTSVAHARGGSAARRPVRFLQGLMVCGLCGGRLHKAGPREAFRCSTRIAKGGCSNTRAPSYVGIEARVMTALRENLLHPEVIEHAVRTMQEGLRQARRDAGKRKAKTAAELAEVKRRADRLLDQVADGLLSGAAIKDKLAGLEARRAQLEAELTGDDRAGGGGVVEPYLNAAGLYRRHVEALRDALEDTADMEGREAREAVRALIQEVRLTPAEGHGQYALEIVGDLAPILRLGAHEKGPLAGASDVAADSMAGMGAGTRIARRHSLPFTQAA